MCPRPFAILALLLAIQMHSSKSLDEQMNLHLCSRNKTLSVHIRTSSLDATSCQCETGLPNAPLPRDSYVHTRGLGSHKLHTNAKSWNEARKICIAEGAHLAILNSKAEETVLVEMLNRNRGSIRNGVNTEEALLGVHDFFKEGEWVTVYGESLALTGYVHWSSSYWGGQPDNKDNNQNCAALIYQGGMDDVHCHESFAFFCELPLNCD